MWYALIALIVLALLVLVMMKVMLRRGRALSTESAQKYRHAWAAMLQIPDEHRKIIEAEKIVESAMRELGYEGSFADKLKKAGPRFRNLQPLWEAHKLRNRIAHEMNVPLSASQANSALHAFERALHDLC